MSRMDEDLTNQRLISRSDATRKRTLIAYKANSSYETGVLRGSRSHNRKDQSTSRVLRDHPGIRESQGPKRWGTIWIGLNKSNWT